MGSWRDFTHNGHPLAIGAVAVFLTTALLGIPVLKFAFRLRESSDLTSSEFLVVLLMASGALSAATVLLYALLTHQARDTETRCRKCGYILRGITVPRCPECGEII